MTRDYPRLRSYPCQLTFGEARALKAVAAGKVVRIYRQAGNVLKGDGVNSAALWRLAAAKYFMDGPTNSGVFQAESRQILTSRGRDTLARINGAK